MDELAAKLGMCELEIRQKNAVKEGSRRVDGPVYPPIGLEECLQAVQNSDHWNTPLEGPNRGRGIAAGFWFGCGLKSSAACTVNSDGTINLLEGSTDIGGSRTSIAMQLAKYWDLGDDINPMVGDTDTAGYTDVTEGVVTYRHGSYEAGRDLQQQMKTLAADLWDCSADEITVGEDGSFTGGDKTIGFKELATELFQ